MAVQCPEELLQFVRSPSRTSEQHCDEIRRYCKRDNYHWGFRIYRTSYSSGSNDDFQRALDVFHAYMHAECFEDVVRSNDKDHESEDSDDMSPEERAFYDNWPEGKPFPVNEHGEADIPDFGKNKPREAPDSSGDPEDNDPGEIVDDQSNQILWKRLRNDIVQDPTLEGASSAQLHDLFAAWVQSRHADSSECSRYRFFIVLDEEVINNLLKAPFPVP